MVWMNPLFYSSFKNVNHAKYNQPLGSGTLCGGPALLLRIKPTISMHRYFNCGYVNESHDLVISSVNGRIL